MRFGWTCGYGTLRDLIREASAAEAAGFDSVWWLDHLMRGDAQSEIPEMLVTVAAMLASTGRVTVGPAVTDVMRRHPAVIAQAAATLEEAYPGRFVLGLGAGNVQNLRHIGLPLRGLVQSLTEGIEIIGLLLSNPRVACDYEGQFFRLRGARLQIGRGDPLHVPLYIAALGPKMIRLAAKYGSGWLPLGHTPGTYAKTRGILDGHLAASGRDAGSVDHALMTTIHIDKTGAAREAAVRIGKEFLAKNPDAAALLPNPPPLTSRLRLPFWDVEGSDSDQAARQRTAIQSISEDDALQAVVYGSPQECARRLAAWRDGGCDHIIFMPYHLSAPERMATIKILGADILPAVSDCQLMGGRSA